ncbi:MAG: hypothetical protein KC646_08030 [Candidatus Cloacimonetes bacterium]|nr:hypothetical protein [Candidatus Cloacimonadota bacterium]
MKIKKKPNSNTKTLSSSIDSLENLISDLKKKNPGEPLQGENQKSLDHALENINLLEDDLKNTTKQAESYVDRIAKLSEELTHLKNQFQKSV